MRPTGILGEVVTGLLFLAAGGNVFVYTVKSYRATFNSPPLKAWQTGGGLLSGPQGEGESKGKGKGESLPEELLNGAGEAFKKGLEIIPGGGLPL